MVKAALEVETAVKKLVLDVERACLHQRVDILHRGLQNRTHCYPTSAGGARIVETPHQIFAVSKGVVAPAALLL